jgi:hypothetical protein
VPPPCTRRNATCHPTRILFSRPTTSLTRWPRLTSAGFARHVRSRIFHHPLSAFTIDFPKGPLAVGGEYVRQTATLKRGEATLHILSRTDCIRDRLAHFFHWNDYTALNAAVGVAVEKMDDIDVKLLRSWAALEGSECIEKLGVFEDRVRAALRNDDGREA